jgi:glycine/D-amino acid oxidase-like deaminating enzyme
MKHRQDILIIGGGVFGITSAIELTKRKYDVTLINPDRIPHHLAASTDISKAVRMEYGSDIGYFKMAEICINRFHEWNDLFKEELYHEVGFLMLCKEKLESKSQTYERESFQNLSKAGYKVQRMDSQLLAEHFPAINPKVYIDGNFNPRAGYVESGKMVAKLTDYARSLGVKIIEGQTAHRFVVEKGNLESVITKEGTSFHSDHTVVAAGANTPFLLPELQPYMKTTGHPVFWLRPVEKHNYASERLPVFTADISNSGWYGFPISSDDGVVKIAKHTNGVIVRPDQDDRRVTDADVEDMRNFVRSSMRSLSHAPLVFTRRCLYTDTLDGHFWIDHHPELKGLSVSSGGSGHGMKMAPILGEITADVIEGKSNEFSERFKWRHLSPETIQVEEARCVMDRKI